MTYNVLMGTLYPTHYTILGRALPLPQTPPSSDSNYNENETVTNDIMSPLLIQCHDL